MSLPIRCFSCGKVFTNTLYTEFNNCQDKDSVYNKFNITRYCCKRMLLTSVDTFDLTSLYTTIPDSVNRKQEQCENRIYIAN